MTTVSIRIETSKRGPPRRRSSPTAQPTEQIISYQISLREIAKAMSEIQRLDELMTTLDTRLNDYTERLSDPDQDGWDVIDIQANRDRVLTTRAHASFDLMMAVNTVIYHGGLVIDGWHDADFENIGLKHSQSDRFYRRVADEWPNVASDSVWQRLIASGVPF